jgi:hypothetical protein
LSDLKKQTLEVTMGDGKSMITTQVGKWSGVAVQKDGTTRPITLNKVAFVPKLCVNLFSITQVMKLGATLSSTALTICALEQTNQLVTEPRRVDHQFRIDPTKDDEYENEPGSRRHLDPYPQQLNERV